MSDEFRKRTELLDIEKIIKSKNPRLYKRLPKFIINRIKKIIQQDKLNEFISKYNNNFGYEFLQNCFSHFNIHSEYKTFENLPENSKILIVSNHPIGSFDGLHLIGLVYKKYGKVKAVVNDLLLNVKNLNEFFLGINKHGLTSKQHIEELNVIFDSDIPVIYFPAGLVSRKNNGVIKDLEWKKTFITRAVKHQRDIVPVFVKGQLSKKFYGIDRIRKLLGIKANIEMFWLPQEMIKQTGKTLIFTFGKPVSYLKFNSEKNYNQFAQDIKNHVYKLENNPHAIF